MAIHPPRLARSAFRPIAEPTQLTADIRSLFGTLHGVVDHSTDTARTLKGETGEGNRNIVSSYTVRMGVGGVEAVLFGCTRRHYRKTLKLPTAFGPGNPTQRYRNGILEVCLRKFDAKVRVS